MDTLTRQNAIDAVDVLNDFIGDISAGVNVYREYDRQYQKGTLSLSLMIPIQKMCISHIVLTLSKWVETYEKYHRLFPSQFSDVYRKLNSEIRKRGILEFRNKCVGHIWDKKHNRPLTQSEIMFRLNTITNGSMTEFLNWLNDLHNINFPDTVISIVEKTRDYIMSKYSIHPDEVIQR